MDYNFIKNIIDNGGETLTAKLEKATFKTGFYVSLYGFEKAIDKNNLNDIIKTIKEYQEKIKKYKNNNYFIGLWIYKDNCYIDITKHIESKKQAARFGRNNKQLSYYDIKNNKTIYLNNYYILYRYSKAFNDYRYIKEFTSVKDILKDIKLKNKNSIYHYIYNSIEDVTQLLNDRYIIILDHDNGDY